MKYIKQFEAKHLEKKELTLSIKKLLSNFYDNIGVYSFYTTLKTRGNKPFDDISIMVELSENVILISFANIKRSVEIANHMMLAMDKYNIPYREHQMIYGAFKLVIDRKYITDLEKCIIEYENSDEFKSKIESEKYNL